MDVLFYSNYCPHSSKLLQHLAKHGIAAKLNCVCIDRRSRDPTTGQTVILTETGKTINLPVNVQNVPSLLLISQKYRVVVGNDIYTLFDNVVKSNTNTATQGNGEPLGFVLNGGTQPMGDSYDTPLPDAYSNVVSAHHTNTLKIHTPDDTYRPNKIGSEMTPEMLMQMRNEDIPVYGGRGPMI
jgi:hypothetical protein